VLSDLSQSRTLRVFALKHGCRVNTRSKAFARMHTNELLRKRTEPRTNHNVIILTTRVTRNTSDPRHTTIRAPICIPISNTHNAARAGNERCRIKPLLNFFSEVAHATLLASSNPCSVRIRVRSWSRISDAGNRKSVFATPLKNCARTL
jgi:hypothetical protein